MSSQSQLRVDVESHSVRIERHGKNHDTPHSGPQNSMSAMASLRATGNARLIPLYSDEELSKSSDGRQKKSLRDYQTRRVKGEAGPNLCDHISSVDRDRYVIHDIIGESKGHSKDTEGHSGKSQNPHYGEIPRMHSRDASSPSLTFRADSYSPSASMSLALPILQTPGSNDKKLKSRNPKNYCMSERKLSIQRGSYVDMHQSQSLTSLCSPSDNYYRVRGGRPVPIIEAENESTYETSESDESSASSSELRKEGNMHRRVIDEKRTLRGMELKLWGLDNHLKKAKDKADSDVASIKNLQIKQKQEFLKSEQEFDEDRKMATEDLKRLKDIAQSVKEEVRQLYTRVGVLQTRNNDAFTTLHETQRMVEHFLFAKEMEKMEREDMKREYEEEPEIMENCDPHLPKDPSSMSHESSISVSEFDISEMSTPVPDSLDVSASPLCLPSNVKDTGREESRSKRSGSESPSNMSDQMDAIRAFVKDLSMSPAERRYAPTLQISLGQGESKSAKAQDSSVQDLNYQPGLRVHSRERNLSWCLNVDDVACPPSTRENEVMTFPSSPGADMVDID